MISRQIFTSTLVTLYGIHNMYTEKDIVSYIYEYYDCSLLRDEA